MISVVGRDVSSLRLALVLPVLASSVACSSTQVWFSESADLQSLVRQEIEAATSSVHVAIYTFTSEPIRDGLLTAHARGLDVKVCSDYDQYPLNADVIDALDRAGVPNGTTGGYSGGIMHHKFVVIDGERVLTGSFNFTPSADNLNDENLLFLADPALAAQYEAAFSSLWERCSD